MTEHIKNYCINTDTTDLVELFGSIRQVGIKCEANSNLEASTELLIS